MGGADDDDNITLLTPKEHFIAHRILYLTYPENLSILRALWGMSNQVNEYRDYIISSRMYERLRLTFINRIEKAVAQYDTEGNLVETFESGLKAHYKTGAHFTDISSCANGKLKSSGGFMWRFVTDDTVPLKIKPYKRDLAEKHRSQEIPVYQCDLNGIPIKGWESYTKAERATGIDKTSISRCVRGISNTAGGFKWKRQ